MTNTTDITPASSTAAAGTLPLDAGRWQLDSYHSQVGFSIRHLGIANIRGHFRGFSATLDVGAGLEDSSLEATVDLGTLDTGNADRDAHVLAADMLDVERHPSLAFRSTAIRPTGADTWDVDGIVTVGEASQPLTLTIELGGVSDPYAIDGLRHAGFEAVGELRRSELGLELGPIGDTMLSDVATLHLDIQLLEPQPDAAG